MRKDEGLDRLAEAINVAQFVAFEPMSAGPRQTFARILGREPNTRFTSDGEAITALLAASGEGSVNVRSYVPSDPRSKEFVTGLKSVEDVLAVLRRISGEGLHTIANEAIDTSDGGVSGVVQGDTIEFAPDSFPRDVEKGGFAALPRALGLAMLQTVFRFRPDIDVTRSTRLEFSLHPRPRGWLGRHTIGWEIEDGVAPAPAVLPAWPNPFSRMVGDKAFGLLVAHHLGLLVPETLVIGRRIAPFSFGEPTGASGIWLRTCPAEQQPGRFTTADGWVDPFSLLANEDFDKEVASILSQASVRAEWSGASQVLLDGRMVVEGKRGSGADLMMGTASGERLPNGVLAAVEEVHERQRSLGPIRTEWVHDGARLWVVQFHRGATAASDTMISAGTADQWVDFDPKTGLPALRTLLADLPAGSGLKLIRPVGVTSHIADTIRRANVPAFVVAAE